MDKILTYKPNRKYESKETLGILYCKGFDSEKEMREVVERNNLGEILIVGDIKPDVAMLPLQYQADDSAYILKLGEQYRMVPSKDFWYLSVHSGIDRKYRRTDIITPGYPDITDIDIQTISMHCQQPMYTRNFITKDNTKTPEELVKEVYEFSLSRADNTIDVFISNGGNIPYLKDVYNCYAELFPRKPRLYINFSNYYKEPHYFHMKMKSGNSSITLTDLDKDYGIRLY
jgi:hypothetical protein